MKQTSLACVRNYSPGSLSTKTCYKRNRGRRKRRNIEEERGSGNNKRQPKTLSKETKALSFWGLFFYCCPLRARLSGLLHNAGPLWAAHHWLSCHFKLVSFLRTAAPEAWTHLSWKTGSGRTHICTEWVDKEVSGKMGTQGEPPSKLLIEITVTLFQPRLSSLKSHTCTHIFFLWHTFGKHVLIRNAVVNEWAS